MNDEYIIPEQPPLFSEYDGSPVDKPSDLDYACIDRCDLCGKIGKGMMYHTAGATGRVCPVIFVCNACDRTQDVLKNKLKGEQQ